MTPEELVRELAEAGRTVAVAESLTGGQLAAAITAVPGASAVFRGSVTAYATDLKATLLGVDPELLARAGAVDAEVARQMAEGVRSRLGADFGLATTGVAGPLPQDGKAVGTVFLGLSVVSGTVEHKVERSVIEAPHYVGDRAAIQRQAVAGVLAILERELRP